MERFSLTRGAGLESRGWSRWRGKEGEKDDAFNRSGGAGFLGSHLCDALLARGNEVLCLDNLIAARPRTSPTLGNRKFRFVHHDVTEYIFVDGPVETCCTRPRPATPRLLKLPIQTLKVGSLGRARRWAFRRRNDATSCWRDLRVYGNPQVPSASRRLLGARHPIGYRGVYDEAERRRGADNGVSPRARRAHARGAQSSTPTVRGPAPSRRPRAPELPLRRCEART